MREVALVEKREPVSVRGWDWGRDVCVVCLGEGMGLDCMGKREVVSVGGERDGMGRGVCVFCVCVGE